MTKPLSAILRAKQCGGCRTRVVTRSEFLEWLRLVDELEARVKELEAEAGDAS